MERTMREVQEQTGGPTKVKKEKDRLSTKSLRIENFRFRQNVDLSALLCKTGWGRCIPSFSRDEIVPRGYIRRLPDHSIFMSFAPVARITEIDDFDQVHQLRPSR